MSSTMESIRETGSARSSRKIRKTSAPPGLATASSEVVEVVRPLVRKMGVSGGRPLVENAPADLVPGKVESGAEENVRECGSGERECEGNKKAQPPGGNLAPSRQRLRSITHITNQVFLLTSFFEYFQKLRDRTSYGDKHTKHRQMQIQPDISQANKYLSKALLNRLLNGEDG